MPTATTLPKAATSHCASALVSTPALFEATGLALLEVVGVPVPDADDTAFAGPTVPPDTTVPPLEVGTSLAAAMYLVRDVEASVLVV